MLLKLILAIKVNIYNYDLCIFCSCRNKVMLSHNLFSHLIDDYGKIAEMPKEVLSQMALDR